MDVRRGAKDGKAETKYPGYPRRKISKLSGGNHYRFKPRGVGASTMMNAWSHMHLVMGAELLSKVNLNDFNAMEDLWLSNYMDWPECLMAPKRRRHALKEPEGAYIELKANHAAQGQYLMFIDTEGNKSLLEEAEIASGALKERDGRIYQPLLMKTLFERCTKEEQVNLIFFLNQR